MTRPTIARGSALLIAAACLSVPASAAVQAPTGCPAASAPAPAKKKKVSLGGLIGAARSAGLMGSVAGAMRGDGNLGADIKGAGKAAATRAAESALNCAASAGAAAGSAPTQADSPEVMELDIPARSQAATPTRVKAAARLSYPSEIAKPAGFEATRHAYDDFGKVDCSDCEGGFAYDGWAVFPRDEYSGKYNGDAQRLGGWPVGHVHRWKGNESSGTLTVVAEQTVSGFRCRTLLYRLAKGKASAERPGLLCWGRANQFAGKESWNHVY